MKDGQHRTCIFRGLFQCSAEEIHKSRLKANGGSPNTELNSATSEQHFVLTKSSHEDLEVLLCCDFVWCEGLLENSFFRANFMITFGMFPNFVPKNYCKNSLSDLVSVILRVSFLYFTGDSKVEILGVDFLGGLGGKNLGE